MISFIRGTVADITEVSAIIEVGGIGYEVFMTGSDLSRLHGGEDVYKRQAIVFVRSAT